MNIFVLLCSFIWMFICTTLPKLYFRLSKKRNIAVKQFRDCERLTNKCAKLQLDITYLYNCDSLGLFPMFVCVCFPKLNVYENAI